MEERTNSIIYKNDIAQMVRLLISFSCIKFSEGDSLLGDGHYTDTIHVAQPKE